MSESDRSPVYWNCSEDEEILTHETKNNAIEEFLDNIDPNEQEETITVYGYVRMVAPKPDMEDAVTLVGDWFDTNWEELQGEDGPDILNSTYEAALVFLTVLHKEYVPWACEQVTSEEVNVAEWIAANRPDWLKPKPRNGA